MTMLEERARPRSKRALGPPQRRAALVSSRGTVGRHLAEREEMPSSPIRFVARCLQTWADAGASPARFFAAWIPVRVPGAPLPSLPRASRPRAASRPPVRTHRAAPQRRRGADAAALMPASRRSSLLRTRYPYVAALLLELGVLSRDPALTRRQTRTRTAR